MERWVKQVTIRAIVVEKRKAGVDGKGKQEHQKTGQKEENKVAREGV